LLLLQLSAGVRAERREAANMRVKEDQRVKDREETELQCINREEADRRQPDILEEIEIEDFAVDGICGVY
jgi:mycofactocin precursor